MLSEKIVVVTGGTGSLGQVLVRRLLSGELGVPAKIIVFSRDEAKQHAMRLDFQRRREAVDDSTYWRSQHILDYRIGDVRDFQAVSSVLREANVVINAAGLKQVPVCEYFPYEAIQTNTQGSLNIVRAVREHSPFVDTLIGVSTDKACKPVCVMGMTKALQERVFLHANLECPATRIMCVRYGNVMASRGSVIPMFQDQIRRGGPVTVTNPEMTRFVMSIDDAVEVILAAIKDGRRGELYVRRAPSARLIDLAQVLIGHRSVPIKVTGSRPGEKVHETLVAEEEASRTYRRGHFLVVQSILPELALPESGPPLGKSYGSAEEVMSQAELRALLQRHRLLVDGPEADQPDAASEAVPAGAL